MKKLIHLCASLCGVALALAATGCMTGQDKATLDAISGASQPTYVEAFVEYPGPAAKWAGPPSFVMHVLAKEGEKPEVTVPPGWLANWGTMSDARRPASQLLTGEEARAKIGELASAISDGGTDYHGCLYPIHVRLIRADGKVVDQQGCRGQSRWASAASDALDFFVASVRARN